MATRSHIYFCERTEGVSFNEHHQDKVEFMIYNHHDSYPEDLGLKLANFLDDVKFHDIGCLAASVVGKLKMVAVLRGTSNVMECIPHIGGVYLINTKCLIDSSGYEEYSYYIWTKFNCNEVYISIFSDDKCIFVGQPKALQTKYDN